MIRSDPLDAPYFEWLCRRIEISTQEKTHARSFLQLVQMIHGVNFRWFIPNDDNRAEDGVELRQWFLQESGIEHADHFWMQRPCTVLEMLVALAEQTAFQSRDTAARWFWVFLGNLNVHMFSDGYIREYPASEQDIRQALEGINDRTYGSDGLGGLFPLKHPEQDQRKVELWYQMSFYLLEGG